MSRIAYDIKLTYVNAIERADDFLEYFASMVVVTGQCELREDKGVSAQVMTTPLTLKEPHRYKPNPAAKLLKKLAREECVSGGRLYPC